MYYPGGMKARVSPVQSIEPHRILAPTRDSNQEPPGPESRVVTTILPLHTKPDPCPVHGRKSWILTIDKTPDLENNAQYESIIFAKDDLTKSEYDEQNSEIILPVRNAPYCPLLRETGRRDIVSQYYVYTQRIRDIY